MSELVFYVNQTAHDICRRSFGQSQYYFCFSLFVFRFSPFVFRFSLFVFQKLVCFSLFALEIAHFLESLIFGC